MESQLFAQELATQGNSGQRQSQQQRRRATVRHIKTSSIRESGARKRHQSHEAESETKHYVFHISQFSQFIVCREVSVKLISRTSVHSIY